MKKEDALKALTNSAKLINKYHLIGSIEAGKKANFIICSDDIFIEEIFMKIGLMEKNVIKEKNNEDIEDTTHLIQQALRICLLKLMVTLTNRKLRYHHSTPHG